MSTSVTARTWVQGFVVKAFASLPPENAKSSHFFKEQVGFATSQNVGAKKPKATTEVTLTSHQLSRNTYLLLSHHKPGEGGW